METEEEAPQNTNGETSNVQEEVKEKVPKKKEVYLPGKPIEEDEELVCDQSAYIMLRQVQTGAPCLSFDIIQDDLGSNREEYPLTCYLVAGTQGPKPKENCLLVMKMSNLHKTLEDDNKEDAMEEDDEDDDDDEENEPEEKRPQMEYASIAHFGCINRIRCTNANNTVLAASWSETGRVSIWDIRKQIQAVNDLQLLNKYRQDNEIVNSKPIFTFSGHVDEGFAIDWCPTSPGVLATGDCKKNIHLWYPQQDGWRVNQKPLIGHTASVEDIQWSPNEQHVLASVSVDKSVRVWDARASVQKACMITVENAHQSDVNVMHWNRNGPFLATGGDDGYLHVWDLRQLKNNKPVATFKHHSAPITTVEWHPSEVSVLASGGEDNQIALWDISVEKDAEAEVEDIDEIPPQLLFIHQGQTDVKELHWHRDIPGLIISTALSGFNIFRTISV